MLAMWALLYRMKDLINKLLHLVTLEFSAGQASDKMGMLHSPVCVMKGLTQVL